MANNINWGKIYNSTWWGSPVDGGWGGIYYDYGYNAITVSYNTRVLADGGTVESLDCVNEITSTFN
jgi:hypothetical protein